MLVTIDDFYGGEAGRFGDQLSHCGDRTLSIGVARCIRKNNEIALRRMRIGRQSRKRRARMGRPIVNEQHDWREYLA